MTEVMGREGKESKEEGNEEEEDKLVQNGMRRRRRKTDQPRLGKWERKVVE